MRHMYTLLTWTWKGFGTAAACRAAQLNVNMAAAAAAVAAIDHAMLRMIKSTKNVANKLMQSTI